MYIWQELFPGGYSQAIQEVEELYHIKSILSDYGITVESLEEFLVKTAHVN